MENKEVNKKRKYNKNKKKSTNENKLNFQQVCKKDTVENREKYKLFNQIIYLHSQFNIMPQYIYTKRHNIKITENNIKLDGYMIHVTIVPLDIISFNILNFILEHMKTNINETLSKGFN